jgi:ribosomal protein L28
MVIADRKARPGFAPNTSAKMKMKKGRSTVAPRVSTRVLRAVRKSMSYTSMQEKKKE